MKLGFLDGLGKNKQLENIIFRMEMNISNNYKDASQACLKEFETELNSLRAAGKLNDKQKEYYNGKLEEFQKALKDFTHKAQRATW